MSLRPCLECGQLTSKTRCPPCESQRNRQRDEQRGSRQQRGYDSVWDKLSKQIIERDHGVCHWCGGTATTTDHVVPKVMGGTDDPSNLVAACVLCNSGRRPHFFPQ